MSAWADIAIDDELEVAWAPGSARGESCVWVVFTAEDGTPFVTASRWLLETNALCIHFDAGHVWPLIVEDRVLSVRRGALR